MRIYNENEKVAKYFLDYIYGKTKILKFLEVDSLFRRFIGLEQNSYYHKETLDEHLELIDDWISKYERVSQIKGSNTASILRLLNILHDTGKVFTRKTKRENLVMNGKVDCGDNYFLLKNGEKVLIERANDFQFLGHEKASANIFLFNYSHIIPSNIGVSEIEVYWLLLNHLVFNKKEEEKVSNGVSKNIIDIGVLFSECDSKGRISLN